jgi:hypothetical protein
VWKRTTPSSDWQGVGFHDKKETKKAGRKERAAYGEGEGEGEGDEF